MEAFTVPVAVPPLEEGHWLRESHLQTTALKSG